jgi:hypothetical protein
MKKVLVILLVSAFVSAFAFADGITFGAWGRVGFIVAQQTGAGYVTTGTYPDWAGNTNPLTVVNALGDKAAGPDKFGRVGFSVAGTSENIGFNVNVDSNGGTIGIGDEAKAWVKFGPALKVQVGKVQGNALRGKVGGDAGIQVTSFSDEDGIFQRFYPKAGILVDFTPVEGLYIGAALDSVQYDGAGMATTAAAFAAGQYGVGYTIKDIGQIRAQYRGSPIETGDKFIDAAFALTAVAGLTIDVGTQINTDMNRQSNAILAVAYGKDALSLKLRTQVQMKKDIGVGVYLQGSYVVAAPLAIGADVSFDATTKDQNKLTLCPWLKFGYGQGSAIIGFKYTADLGVVSSTYPAVNNSWASNRSTSRKPRWSDGDCRIRDPFHQHT